MNQHFEQCFRNVKLDLEKPELCKLASKAIFMSGAMAMQEAMIEAIKEKHPEVAKLLNATVAQTHVQFSDSVWAEKGLKDDDTLETREAPVLPIRHDQNS